MTVSVKTRQDKMLFSSKNIHVRNTINNTRKCYMVSREKCVASHLFSALFTCLVLAVVSGAAATASSSSNSKYQLNILLLALQIIPGTLHASAYVHITYVNHSVM